MKILLVEDDEQTVTWLTESLTAHHYLINCVPDGQTAWDWVQTSEYDLILLDVHLPRTDGISLCRKIRTAGYTMPILLLTAEDSVSDRVKGLEAGADDFLSKPFDLAELLARIRALLRRGAAFADRILSWEQLRLNPDSGEVTYANKPLHLTPKEYRLLELFLYNPQRVFSRSALLDRVWTSDEFPGEEAVTTQIKGLRQKLKAAGMKVDPIETQYGLGYRLKPAPAQEPGSQGKAVAASNNAPSSPGQVVAVSDRQAANAKVQAAITAAWQMLQTQLTDRLAVFEQAIGQLKQGKLDQVLRQQAQAEAHKLIGSLGSFGCLEGCTIARELEQRFKAELGGTEAAAYLTQQLTTLKNAIAQPLRLNAAPAPSPAVPPAPTADLLVIDDDAILTAQLQQAAIAWNLRVKVAPDLTTARAKLNCDRPNAILLDLTFSDPNEQGLPFLAEVSRKVPEVPVVVMTAHNRLTDRVTALRLGSRGFLRKPVTPDQVFQAVNRVLNQPQASDAAVLIVDDDATVLNQVCDLLQPWGFRVTTLDDPQQFWELLEAIAPDLLILDIEMPGFNGIELCQVVRNDLRWSQLPILFLSAHTDPETIFQVYTSGADDYIPKPIVGPELIARMLNRLDLVQILRKLAAARQER